MGIDIPTNALGAARFIALPDGVPDDIRGYLADAMLTVLQSDMAAEMFAEQGLVLSPAGPEQTEEIFEATAETLQQYMEAGQ
jgi:tripartite-type tricarboxylate transporter receptor subunit TctC